MQRWPRALAVSPVMALVIMALVWVPNAAHSADAIPASSNAPRVVNVTSDSMPGWLPSEDLERQALKAATDFMAALDKGSATAAYAFLADIERKAEPFAAFSEDLRKFNGLAGPVIKRSIVTVTWTKNPANAPLPGVYVALDQVSQFTNIDRHCGYMVLYQAPEGGDFRVMRRENNFMENRMATAIAKQSSTAAVDAAWAKVSANCPGYKPLLPEVPTSTIGYSKVAEALKDLTSRPGLNIRTINGWTVITDEKAMTIWSFAPVGNAANPAVVKRWITSNGNGSYMSMDVLCEASKSNCDDLVRTFSQMNGLPPPH